MRSVRITIPDKQVQYVESHEDHIFFSREYLGNCLTYTTGIFGYIDVI